MPNATLQWSPQSAWKWYDRLPYQIGANFIPSTAINQLEMWQAETFDAATIDRELGWAAKLGMNVMRVYLHDLLWAQDADGFCRRIEQYLSIASGHGILTLFTLLDDCWNDTFALGPQPAAKPCSITPVGSNRRVTASSIIRRSGRRSNAMSNSC